MDTKLFIHIPVHLFNSVKLTLLCYALYIGVNTVTQLRVSMLTRLTTLLTQLDNYIYTSILTINEILTQLEENIKFFVFPKQKGKKRLTQLSFEPCRFKLINGKSDR
jgi:hypothetical protein